MSDRIFIQSPGSCPVVGLGGIVGGEVKKRFPKFNQIRCASYLNVWHMQRHNSFGSPTPGALGRDQKVKYHSISITKSISKIFKTNFVCLLTNERYKSYQTGFSFGRLGHAQRVGLGVPWGWGSKSIFFLKFNQSW